MTGSAPVDQIGFVLQFDERNPAERIRMGPQRHNGLTFLLVPLSQPHPRPAAVLVDELDIRHFECPPYR
jgi:hypothetical protein